MQQIDHRQARRGLAVDTENASSTIRPLGLCAYLELGPRRDLPTPGSAIAAMTCPSLFRQFCSARRIASISRSRPTNLVTLSSRALQPCAQRAEPANFVHFDWLADPLDARRPHRLQREIAFDQLAHRTADRDRARSGERLQSRR